VQGTLSISDSEKIANSLRGMIALLSGIWDKVDAVSYRRVLSRAGSIIKKWNPSSDTGKAVERLATWETGCGHQSSATDFRILYKLMEETAELWTVAAFSESFDKNASESLRTIVVNCSKTDGTLLQPKLLIKQFGENMKNVCKAIKEVSGMSIHLAAFHELDPEDIPAGSLGPNSFYTVSCKDVVREKSLGRFAGSRYTGNLSVFEGGATLAWPCPLPDGELDRLTQEMTSFLHSLNADADSLRKLQTAVKQHSSLESQSSLRTDLDQQTRNDFSTILSIADTGLTAAISKATAEESKASSVEEASTVPLGAKGKRKRYPPSNHGTTEQS
jgi:hypothetical protein